MKLNSKNWGLGKNWEDERENVLYPTYSMRLDSGKLFFCKLQSTTFVSG